MNTITHLAEKDSTVLTLDRQITAADVPFILEYFTALKVLSLDCFDTILLRKTATPVDVFFDLQSRAAFQALEFTATMRINAEATARRRMKLRNGKQEVKLSDIYLASFPNLNEEQLRELMEEELAAEMEACYAFPPTLELIRAAQARNIKVMVVSDTYFNQRQLHRLLSSKLPADVFQGIHTIFCSCEIGVSKVNGLFKHVLKKLQLPSRLMLHVGDNPYADYEAPRAESIYAVELSHHDNNLEELTRMQLLASCLIDPSFRHSRSLPSPFHGVISAALVATEQPESVLGYLSLGPIMYAFAKYIQQELASMQLAGKRPKALFLLRDAYLPAQVCEAIAGEPIGYKVRISRFTAFAASFRNENDIERYLAEVISSMRFQDICRQLLLPEKISKQILKEIANSKDKIAYFIQFIKRPHIIQTICEQSTIYHNRLKKYLEKTIELKTGDTLVFIDLGYTGTAQRELEPIFKEEFGVDIVGRYLISLCVPNWRASRSGLIDASWYDDRTMLTLVNYIALLEQMCTSPESSVVDFDEEGNPVFSTTAIDEQQNQKLACVQAECIRFVRDAEIFFKKANLQLSPSILRDVAAASLARLIYLPTESELAYLQSFQFEVNLGTEDVLEIFNQSAGLQGLRRRGLFFMEKNLKTMRTNYPAELRSAGLEFALTLIAQHRFGLDFIAKDLSHRRESISLLVIQGNQNTNIVVEALPTYDGYFSLVIPIGTGNFHIGIVFGANYQWLQLESVERILTTALLSSIESQNTEDIRAHVLFDQMVEQGDNLFECLNDTSLAIIEPSVTPLKSNHVVRIVFRPLIKKIKN